MATFPWSPGKGYAAAVGLGAAAMGAAAMGALRAMARAASSAETLGGNGAGSRCAKNDRGTEGNNAACMEWNVRDVSDARNAHNAHNARDERTPGGVRPAGVRASPA